MRQQIRSMQAMVESGRAAANVLEQKLAIAEVGHPHRRLAFARLIETKCEAS